MNVLPLPYDEALRIIAATLPTSDIIRVPLMDSLGCVLAEPVKADLDVPPFARAMMDGFAVRSEDTQACVPGGTPVELRVIEEAPAGTAPTRRVGPGEAIRVMTGSMIPEGADAVCRFEATKDGFATHIDVVSILRSVRPGENVARQGEDIAAGAAVLAAGTRIGAAESAVLATFGFDRVAVYRKPVVGILATGSELVDVAATPGPGQLRNSNTAMVAALVRQAGGIPLPLKTAADDTAAIAAEISAVLPDLDMLVTIGGVSVGDYDCIADVYDRLGAETQFWKVLVRPGSPLRYANKGRIPLFGISGNPAAAFANTQLFVLPALRRMEGESEPVPKPVSAILTQALALPAIKQTRFLRATAYWGQGRLLVRIPAGQSSGMIGSLVGANCFVRIRAGETFTEGDQVDVLLFDMPHTI